MCINKGAEGAEEPEADQTRWRWSSSGLTGFLPLQVSFCGPALGLLLPWCATITPEVRSHALKCNLKNEIHICNVSELFWCRCSTVWVPGEELLAGGKLDGQRLHAVHLSAPCGSRLLRDVSTHKTSNVVGCKSVWGIKTDVSSSRNVGTVVDS